MGNAGWATIEDLKRDMARNGHDACCPLNGLITVLSHVLILEVWFGTVFSKEGCEEGRRIRSMIIRSIQEKVEVTDNTIGTLPKSIIRIAIFQQSSKKVPYLAWDQDAND